MDLLGIFVPLHLVFVYFFVLLYFSFVVIMYCIYNIWVYPLLDWSNHYAFVYYTSMFLLPALIFGAGYLFVKLRDRQKHTKQYRHVQEEAFSF